jgi:hypothetical protein
MASGLGIDHLGRFVSISTVKISRWIFAWEDHEKVSICARNVGLILGRRIRMFPIEEAFFTFPSSDSQILPNFLLNKTKLDFL